MGRPTPWQCSLRARLRCCAGSGGGREGRGRRRDSGETSTSQSMCAYTLHSSNIAVALLLKSTRPYVSPPSPAHATLPPPSPLPLPSHPPLDEDRGLGRDGLTGDCAEKFAPAVMLVLSRKIKEEERYEARIMGIAGRKRGSEGR